MEPLTLFVIIILPPLLITTYWPEIIDHFSTKVIPWLRLHLSSEVADLVAAFVNIADGKIVPVRRQLKSCWQALNQVILGSRRTFQKVNANTAKSKTETFFQTEDQRTFKQTVEEEVSWEDLPEKIRAEMIRQNARKAQMDLKKAMQEKFQERAQEAGMTLEVAG